MEQFEILNPIGNDVVVDVLEDGSFSLPALQFPEKGKLAEAFLAVVRDADAWRDDWNGYPRYVDTPKSREIRNMRAYIIELPLKLL